MPEKLQNYTVSDRIGTGGTGIVRRGRETETKADVAVKSLSPDLVREPQTRKRLKEARKSLQSMPQQENLVRVLDIIESGDTMHVIMEYAPGRNLDNLLSKKSRPMPHESAVQLLNQALRGAVAAHSKGFLHGNLKPSDLIMTGDNAVRVGGFGIAPHLSNAALVRSAARTGKIAYMSPEQVRGESIDERSDVYSLGVILYRMITGKMPFAISDRDSESRLRQAVLQQQTPDITEAMPELNIPPYLANIVRRALAKDRRERIPTTREFARLLQKVQPEVPSPIVSKPAPDKVSDTKKMATGAAVIGTAASAVAANITPSRPPAMQFPPPQAPPLATIQPSAFVEIPQPSADTSSATPANTLETANLEPTPALSPAIAPTQAVESSGTATPPEKSASEKSGLSAFLTKAIAPPVPEAPTVFTTPTLTKTPMQLEVERRMQAVKNEQAERAAQEAAQTPTPSNFDTTFGEPQNTTSTGIPPIASNRPPSPETLTKQLTPSEPIKPVAKNEEKKKRAVLPWLVMGAVALGGGIYYVALKNKNTDGVNQAAQRELSPDEQERRYDSLLSKSEKAVPSNDATTPENVNAEKTDSTSPTPENTTETKAQPDATTKSPSMTEEKPRIPETSEPTKTAQIEPSEKTAVAKNTPPKPSANTATAKAANSTEPPIVRKAAPKAASEKQAPSALSNSLASEPTSEPRKTKRNTASERVQTESTLPKRSTEKAAAQNTSPAQTTPTQTATTQTPSAKTPPKSGSLSDANAQSLAEREAARERVRRKYAEHLSKKGTVINSKKISPALAVNTPNAPTNEGKATPDALKEMNTKKAPRTNREDNYVPATNPAESPNTVDPSATDLVNAARRAKSIEPFLILRGHVGTVRSVTFSPDGKMIASGSDDKTVKIWDAATGTILRSLRGHSGTVTSVFFSPDGKTLISSGKDKTVRVWDAATGEALQRSPGVSCEGTPAAFSPDGKTLATTDSRNINISKVQR
jgi:serine/threonine protein kinase